MAGDMTVAAGAATHTGLVRRTNEDAYLATSPFFLVADGMGGHNAGAAASAAVVSEFARATTDRPVSAELVETLLERARSRVARIDGGARPAGSTLTGVALMDDGGSWLVVNVGDSRTYRLSRGTMERLTVDHSIVQELIDRGSLDGDLARVDTRRNVITRAIGAGTAGRADMWVTPARVGDRILVCSDGVTGELTDDEIAEVLRSVAHPQQAALHLIHQAMVRGGHDNITAIVVDAVAVSEDGVDEDTSPRERVGSHS